MGVKVYLKYDGEGPESVPVCGQRLGREAFKAKITLPDSWMAGPAEKVLNFFCQTYNKKFPEKPLNPEDMTLKVGDVTISPSGTVSQYVQEHNDVLLVHKPLPTEVAEADTAGTLICSNFGCGKRYKPEENADGSCHHHAKGPVFHDTYKYWGCCPEQKAYDWEQFEAIPKCVISSHCTTDRQVTFTSPNAIANQALSAEQLQAMTRPQAAAAGPMMEGGKPRNGPREFDEGRLADEPGPIAPDGTAKCRNNGCQQRFDVATNNDTACRYHSAGPVFWDTYKFWKCCPDRKHIDFDDFAKVEGCCTGPHKR